MKVFYNFNVTFLNYKSWPFPSTKWMKYLLIIQTQQSNTSLSILPSFPATVIFNSFIMLFNNAIVAIAVSVAVNALPQTYPNKCGDQVCPADKSKCCEVIVNGVAEIGCFAECPPIQALQRRQTYPNKC